jgi:hypothetical protein
MKAVLIYLKNYSDRSMSQLRGGKPSLQNIRRPVRRSTAARPVRSERVGT